jgi:glycerol-3-phosphate dehydrogenase subunit C
VLGNVVPDTDVRMVEECSAVDGTWGMKAEHYETGRKYAQKLVAG